MTPTNPTDPTDPTNPTNPNSRPDPAGRPDRTGPNDPPRTVIDGSVVAITGGASGIGRGIALEVARRGASVAIADIHQERLEATTEELRQTGVDAIGVHCDVTSDADVEGFRDECLARFGRVDVLCNNAGVAVLGPPERVPIADWEWILQVNVLGLVRGVRAFVPAMLELSRPATW